MRAGPSSTKGDCVYSLIIPVFNEEAVIPILLHRIDKLLDRLDGPAEAIFVDDGSKDTSSIVLSAKAKSDPRYRFVQLSRNFGHQIAITAGMDRATGRAVIVMDADLQDPPEVVLQLIEKWKEGFDVVYAQRLSREGETRFKTWSASLFYKLLGKVANIQIPRNVGDFRLVDRKVLDAFKAMPERDRFVRGMFSWVGFTQTAVPFHREARAAGETKYPFWKMLKLASNGIISFSDAPLKLAVWAGVIVSGLAVLYGVYAVAAALLGETETAGWASIITIVSFLSGVNMLLLGIIGIYVGRIHNEVKQRPLYVVDKLTGFDRKITAPKTLPDAAKTEAAA